jgi:hypothetical protein
MKKLVRLAGLSVMALSLTTGVAAAQTGSIENTGPDSYNKVIVKHSDTRKVRNNNHVGVENNNTQRAYTGDASVRHNTTGGDATSGDAANDNFVTTTIGVSNSGSSAAALGGSGGGSGSGSIDTTGPDSYNKVVISDTSYVKVTNNNDVNVQNNNYQKASSGDAKVSGNTTGGDATSGNATNSNDVATTITISN